MALKSLDIFSVHGFPVGLIQCESNFLGIANGGGLSVGSGGWSNIMEKYIKAKTYCNALFETRHEGKRKIQVPIWDEWIGDRKNGDSVAKPRSVRLLCQSATSADLPPESLDGVFTDPPYFGNVQYAELMDFCYVWVRKMVEPGNPAFQHRSTRNADELTGNITMERGLDHFTEGMSAIFRNMAKALKPGKPLAFTYHHNRLEAYYPVMVAILDAGLTCTASIPCPAEMGASIHISGTGSSIVDTVLVCRSTGVIPRKWLVETPEQMAALVLVDLDSLKIGGLQPTRGDIRCIIYGHLARLAIWRLRSVWKTGLAVSEKLAIVAAELDRGPSLESIEHHLARETERAPLRRYAQAREEETFYGGRDEEVSF